MDKMREKMEIILRNRKIILDDIVDLGSPDCVLDEVRVIISKSFPKIDFDHLDMVHADILKLFTGEYPGYKECTTGYHDLRHTLDVFLAMARIIHGASLQGRAFEDRDVMLALVSALLHDTGYIQKDDDVDGTGGKYTLTHVKRSVEFMKRYFADNGFPDEDTLKAEHMIETTSLAADFEKIPYASKEISVLAKMLFASDLLGQMADRTYLEKLHLLYYEFIEGDITEFSDEEALLRETVKFSEVMLVRIMGEVESVSGYLQSHFKARCNINRDLYMESIERNVNFLKSILSDTKSDYRTKLNRMGILERMENLGEEAE